MAASSWLMYARTDSSIWGAPPPVRSDWMSASCAANCAVASSVSTRAARNCRAASAGWVCATAARPSRGVSFHRLIRLARRLIRFLLRHQRTSEPRVQHRISWVVSNRSLQFCFSLRILRPIERGYAVVQQRLSRWTSSLEVAFSCVVVIVGLNDQFLRVYLDGGDLFRCREFGSCDVL